jgi:hypothetical protein
MKHIPKRQSTARAAGLSATFVLIGLLLFVYAIIFEMQITALIGLGLVFWGGVFALTRSGKYVETSLLDESAKTAYTTIDRMMNDFNYGQQGYYIPAYPFDSNLPEYLQNLRQSVVYISDSFDGKPSVDELVVGKFISKNGGLYIISPGFAIIGQIEKELKLDFTETSLQELCDVLPKCFNEMFNLSRFSELILTPNGAYFKASGLIYESLYRSESQLKSVSVLGCPVVSAVACALSKASGKVVFIKEYTSSPINCGVHVTFEFIQVKT